MRLVAFLGLLSLVASGCGRERVSAPEAPALPAASGFKAAVDGRRFSFPRDHGSHPEYASEWWYYTGHLRSVDGHTYGYELTLFRVGLNPYPVIRASNWAVQDIYFAHMAITDERARRFRYFDHIRRGSLRQAGADTWRLNAHVGGWSAGMQGNVHTLRAGQDGEGFDLTAVPLKPPAIHGVNGISRKGAGPGKASYYYSYTRMATKGRIRVDGVWRDVIGESWFDHEFGSSQLSAGQVGWDWFSLQMDNGTEAMLYLMRDAGNVTDPYSSGTFIDANGKTKHLRKSDFRVEILDHWRSPESGGEYPSRWRIVIPSVRWDLTVTPTVAGQELRTTASSGVTYYEGSSAISGQIGGREAHGKAYVELTGYSGEFQQTF